MNSNVSITENVEVNSRESRIELRELRFDGTLWSTLSTVHFDPRQGYINLTARDVVARFTLNKALFEAYADGFRVTILFPNPENASLILIQGRDYV